MSPLHWSGVKMHCRKTPSISNFLIIAFWHYELSPSLGCSLLWGGGWSRDAGGHTSRPPGTETEPWCLDPPPFPLLGWTLFLQESIVGASCNHGLYCANWVQCSKLVSMGPTWSGICPSAFFFFKPRWNSHSMKLTILKDNSNGI